MKCCGRLVLMRALLEKRLEGEGVFKNVVRGFSLVHDPEGLYCGNFGVKIVKIE